MKFKSIILLLVVSLLFTACDEEAVIETQLEKIQKNNMDFPDLKTNYFDGISFKLSDLFEQSYIDDFAYHINADVRIIAELPIYFTVESFNEYEANDAQFGFEEEIDPLDAVHDMYASRRIGSLDKASVSIKKELPKEVKFPGYIQVISGAEMPNADWISYFHATLEIDGKYFVFQLIGKQENMAYVYDDFLDILASIKF